MLLTTHQFFFPAKKKIVDLNGISLETCKKSEEFLQYKNVTKMLDKTNAISFWKTIGCIPKCTYTQYKLTQVFDSNYNKVKYSGGKDEGANIELTVVALTSEIEIKERMWIYDGNSLFADIGGYMGLLLGASIYTFADLLVSGIEHFINIKN